MTATLAPAAPPGVGRRDRTRLIATFAVTQTIGYGVLSYSFGVLLPAIATDLHTSRAAVTAAYTVSVLASAVAAVPIGQILDRYGGRMLMTAGSALGAAAVLAWSNADSILMLYLAFVLIGIASAMSLYEAAFPVLVAAVGPARRAGAILAVTIVAGFASSIFFPLTGWLLDRYGWRPALLVLALLLAAAGVPPHALIVPGRRVHASQTVGDRGAATREALRDRGFWLLTAAFIANSAAVAMLSIHLITYLTGRGLPATTAASLAGLLGILSVTGRITTSGFARHWSMPAVTATVFAVQAAGATVLALAGRTIGGAATGIVLFGLGFGVATIARPAILADRYGTTAYATIAATMAVPSIVVKAGAPVAAAAAPLAWLPILVGVCSAAAVVTLAVASRRSHADSTLS
jgi:MFS family permease